YGGVRASQRHPLTINLEKIKVLRLAPKTVLRNPLCPKCGKRLKSMGRDKGFRCERCGGRYADVSKVEVKMRRDIKRVLYMTSPRSQRHLTKPLRRYGMEKRRVPVKELIDLWHFP
ncbi:hypothetical protein KAU93_04275, partial [Candidatus Bathyarchaeota archaeon]|nr:hypothetical protein [Candidatus Bathyarchaeota archaeon]